MTRNERYRGTVISAQPEEPLLVKAVGENDATTLTESHRRGKASPRHVIIATTTLSSGVLEGIFWKRNILEFGLRIRRRQQAERNRDVGDVVTATVKWAS